MKSAGFTTHQSVHGFTLIELLVVISLISVLAFVGISNFKNFSSDDVLSKALQDIKSALRLAQSNASSSTVCGQNGPASFSVIIKDQKNFDLTCSEEYIVQKSYILENASIESIIGQNCPGTSILPLTLNYAKGSALASFISESPRVSPDCLSSSEWVLTIKSDLDEDKKATLKLSKGGAIDGE